MATILPIDGAQLLDSKQACKALSISKPTLVRLMTRPDFPAPLRIDPTSARSRLRFFACQLAEWAERQQEQTIEAKAAFHLHRVNATE